MAGERMKLVVQERAARGSAEARRLRKRGLVPGVIYGRGKDPVAICVPERDLRRALTGDHGLHAILDVVVGDGDGAAKGRPSILKDYQRDVLTGRVAHVDLQEVRLDRPIQAQVVIELVGDPVGVREGGVLSQVTREVNVEALPLDVPDRIELDVSGMAIGDSLRVADLSVAENVTLLDDFDETVLATVTMPTRVVEREELVEEEEGVEGIPAEEMPEGAAEGPAEPGGDAAGSPGTVEG